MKKKRNKHKLQEGDWVVWRIYKYHPFYQSSGYISYIRNSDHVQQSHIVEDDYHYWGLGQVTDIDSKHYPGFRYTVQIGYGIALWALTVCKGNQLVFVGTEES